MNKVIVTQPQLFMMVVGPSESGKTRLVADVIIKQKELFYPRCDKKNCVYQHWQEIYTENTEKLGPIINFIEGLNWSKINSHPETDRQLIIFDDVYAEGSRQEELLNLDIYGRHKNQHARIFKHNLYQKSPNSKTIDVNATEMPLLKNPQDVVKFDVLGRQLRSRDLVQSAYKLATEEPFGHLLIYLDTRCSEHLRFYSHLTDDFSIFYIVGISQKKIELDEQFTPSDYFQIKLLINFKPVPKRFALIHLDDSFIRILVECLYNIAQGNVSSTKTSVTKQQFKKFKNILFLLCDKKAKLPQKRKLLASNQGLQRI